MKERERERKGWEGEYFHDNTVEGKQVAGILGSNTTSGINNINAAQFSVCCTLAYVLRTTEPPYRESYQELGTVQKI
jgi:hypothetical protein